MTTMKEIFGHAPTWQDRAACAHSDPGPFVGPDRDEDLAKRTCGRCTVLDDCLSWALEHDERYGVWGGLSARERDRLRRGRR